MVDPTVLTRCNTCERRRQCRAREWGCCDPGATCRQMHFKDATLNGSNLRRTVATTGDLCVPDVSSCQGHATCRVASQDSDTRSASGILARIAQTNSQNLRLRPGFCFFCCWMTSGPSAGIERPAEWFSPSGRRGRTVASSCKSTIKKIKQILCCMLRSSRFSTIRILKADCAPKVKVPCLVS